MQSLLPNYSPVTGREPPRRLRELLREIDPTAELIYGGAGVWMLGSVRHSRPARKKAERMIATLEKLSAVAGRGSAVVPARVRKVIRFRLWRYELYRQGFRPITTYKVQGEPNSSIVEDFRRRDHGYRTNFTQILRETEEAADAELEAMKQLEKFEEALEHQAADAHRHAFRTPVHSIPKRRTAHAKR